MIIIRNWCLWRQEEGIRFLGTGITDGCKLPCGCWKLKLDSATSVLSYKFISSPIFVTSNKIVFMNGPMLFCAKVCLISGNLDLSLSLKSKGHYTHKNNVLTPVNYTL